MIYVPGVLRNVGLHRSFCQEEQKLPETTTSDTIPRRPSLFLDCRFSLPTAAQSLEVTKNRLESVGKGSIIDDY